MSVKTKDEILLWVTDVLRDVLMQPALQVTAYSTADQVAGWDSLTHMTLISRIEQDFGVEFQFQEIIALEKVGDLIDRISEKLG
jgi:acyl carrier protein